MKGKIDKRKPIAIHPGQHKALIPQELFLKNQEILASRRSLPTKSGRPARRYVLRGVGKCWECYQSFGEIVGLRGSPGGRNNRPRYKCAAIHSRYASRRPKNPNSLLATLEHLELSIRGRQDVRAWQARHHTFLEDKALEDVKALIFRLEISPDWQRQVLAYLHHPDGILYFNRQLRSLREMQATVQRAYRNGEIDLAELQIENARIEAQIAAFWRMRLPHRERYQPCLQHLPSLWERMTSAEQNGLLTIIFEALFFDNQGRLRWAVAHAPFDRLLGIPAEEGTQEM